jgi:Carboxypeptidase regulatory-like domain
MKIASVCGTFAAVTLGLGLSAVPAVPTAHASLDSAAVHASQRPTGPRDAHLIGGVVRLTDGEPAGDVCVSAAGPMGTAQARTAATGRYELAVPRPGSYVLAYRDCGPGELAGLSASAAAGPAAVRQVRAAGSVTVAAPVTLPQQTSQRSLQSALTAAGVSTPRAPRRFAVAVLRAAKPDLRLDGIAGKVTGPSGRPLSGVCVWIVGNGWAQGSGTNKNGTYSNVGGPVPAGWYPIEFTSNCNSFPFPAGPWAPEWYRHAFSQPDATKVHIRAGQITRNVNAVMVRDGEITGTVTGAHGKPVAGICVALTTPSGLEVNQATTRKNGTYRLSGLDPGRYRALFVPGCGGGADYAQAWWPHAPSLKKARPIEVRLDHVTKGIDARLQELGTIRGQVRLGNKSGKPLGGMCVSASPAGNPLGGGFASTARNGTYVIEGLPTGRYRVSVSPGCNNNGNYLSANYPRLVKVADERTVTIDVYLQSGGIISGTVRSAATGKPIAGICVQDENGYDGITNADGTYQVDQLPTEVTTVTFSGGCGNGGSYAPQWYPGQDNAETAATIKVRAGHDTAGINANLLPGATITGRVTAASGKGLGGVCVAATPSYAQLDFGAEAVTTSTGAYSLANLAADDYEINFFGGCSPFTVNLGQQWYRAQPTETTAGLVSARAGATVSGIDGTVTVGGSISGNVTGRSGQSVQFSCIEAINTRTGLAGVSFGVGGGYEVDGLAPGKYRVYVTDCLAGATLAPGQYKTAVTVRARHNTGRIDIVLPLGGTITGRISIRGSGKPAVGVCVTVSNGNPLSGPSITVTDSGGQYRATQLNSGSHKVAIDTSGCEETGENLAPASRPGSVHVRAGRLTSGVNWSVGTGGTISGLVTGPGGQPEPGICVEAYKSAGGPYLLPVAVTGADGSYQLQGLASGRYKVLFDDPSCSFGSVSLAGQWYDGAISQAAGVTVVVTAGHVKGDVDAELGTYGTITGSVTGTAGTSLAGICVSAVPASGNLSPVYTTSSGGTYTLSGLPPGRYRVEFQSGCGAAGWAAQWWKSASSAKKATVLSVLPGSAFNGINASMTAATAGS